MTLAAVFLALTFSARAVVAQSPIYGQCGGQTWTGATTCVSGTTCVYSNPYYSQCLPGAATTTPKPTTSTTPPSSTTPVTVPTSTPTGGTTGYNIRLLPLGDSITYGLQSSSGNGYRSALHDLLAKGDTLDFIGSIKSGTMADNDNEGHSGATIDQIATFGKASTALPAKPNIVLLMAGTNDVFGGSISTAPDRLNNLINQIFAAVPDTILIVATLTPLSSGQAQVNTYNQAITTLVNTKTAAGQHILLASMSSLSSSDLSDGVHPNDGGYVKMANAWYPVVQQALAKGWLVAR